MTPFIILATLLSVTVMVLVAGRIQYLTREMNLTEELAYLESYLKEKPVNVRNYLFIRVSLTSLKPIRYLTSNWTSSGISSSTSTMNTLWRLRSEK